MSIIWLTTLKYLRGIFRNKGRLAILVIAPILFFSFFGFIFTTSNDTVVRTIGVVNYDQGYSENLSDLFPDTYPQSTSNNVLSKVYLELIENHTELLLETDISVSIRHYTNMNDMIADTETLSINIGVVFHENFTESMLYYINKQSSQNPFPVDPANISITTYGDTSTSGYQSGFSLVRKSLNSFVADFINTEDLYDTAPKGGYLTFDTETVQSEEFSPFSFFAAGFLVFLIILQSITVASITTDEKSNKTISRMKLANIRPAELFIGITLGQVLAFSLQYVITVLVLQFWGIQLSFSGWLNVFLVSQLTNIAIIGLSLIVATFAKTSEDAMSITGIGSAPLGFLSGSFTPVPEVFLISSIDLQFWDLIPTYYASQAMMDIIFNRVGFVELLQYIIPLLLYSVVIFMLGIFLFKKYVIDQDL